MSLILSIPVSPEQEDVITDHVFLGKELGMVSDEKAWMLNHARKIYPGCRILGADLDIVDLIWNLTIDTK